MRSPQTFRRIFLLAATGIVAVGAVNALRAQAPATDTTLPAFEVASVKPTKVIRFVCGFQPGGRFMGAGTLQWLIACAYGIPQASARLRMSGGPKWLNDDLFDIEAKAATDWPRGLGMTPEMLSMLRTLLADRFMLRVHSEAREVPVYALVLARRDGRLGPWLHPTAGDCAAWIAGGRRGAAPPPVSTDLPCGRQMVNGLGIRAAAMTLSQLANLLSPRVERPVQDRTGLTGTFYVDLQWRPEQGAPGPPDTPPNPAVAGLPDSLPTSVFTALQEQLGLKLESTKGSSDVLIIDHVEQPTPD
jgi:uncharacterized protein (TIGR03435 family)